MSTCLVQEAVACSRGTCWATAIARLTVLPGHTALAEHVVKACINPTAEEWLGKGVEATMSRK